MFYYLLTYHFSNPCLFVTLTLIFFTPFLTASLPLVYSFSHSIPFSLSLFFSFALSLPLCVTDKEDTKAHDEMGFEDFFDLGKQYSPTSL